MFLHGLTFSGTFLDGFAGERVVAGTGEPEELPGRYALAGLVDAHAHPTVARDEHGPFLADSEYGVTRLREYAAGGVTVIRDVGGLSAATLGFARSASAGTPLVTAAGRFLAPAYRYFPRMHSPVGPDELAAAIKAEVTAGAAWVKIIGDAPGWDVDGPRPGASAATYDLDTLRQAVDAAHAAGARVAVHSNLPDSGLAAIGADSIEHGTALSHAEIEALGARGGAWTPTLCAVLHNRDSSDPEIRKRTDELRERLRDHLPYAVAHGVRVLAGTDVVGTIADEIALLVDHGLTAGQAISAAGSRARDFLGVHPEGDIVTYDDDPLQDPGVLARPAAVVVRGVRLRLGLRYDMMIGAALARGRILRRLDMAPNAASCATLSPKHRYRFPMHDSEVAAPTESDRSGELAEAYDRYADPLYKYCLAALGDPAEAADAVQDTFVIAAARLADLRDPSRLRAWLYAVARNQCLRITPPGRPVFASAPAPYVMAGVATADEDTERARLRDLLDAATAGLTPDEREIIELELRQGLAVPEVASVVGLPRARTNALASRAREHLEDCLAAVVVARAGRRDCHVLSGMLAEWDGQLTVALRQQLHRHIGRCATCSTRRDLELHPGRLFGQSPGEALADAAAASLRVAAGPPGALRASTLTLVAGRDPDATTPHAAVRGRVGVFDSQGFPKPEPGPEAAPARRDGGPARRSGRVAVAAGAAGLVAAAVIGVVAVALADNSGHGKPAAGHLTGSTPSTAPSAVPPLAASPGTSPTRSAAPSSTGSATTTAQGTPTAANHATTPAAPPSATTDPTATGTTATPTATATATPGTLAVSPSGGALAVPPGGTTITLTAHGGPVTWSSSVSSGLGTVHLSPSSGTITGGATVTVTVTASGMSSGQRVTINPGGTVFTIFVSL